MAALVIMAALFALLIGVGTYSKKFISGADDFLLAGRELGVMIVVFGVVASGFAGTTLTMAPGLGVRIGFWGTFSFAFFYAIAGVALYAALFAKTVRRSGAYTLPEWLEMRYGAKVRTMVCLLATLGLIGLTANNTLALANVISGYFGWNINLCIFLGLAVVLVFTWCSGMWGVSMTDFIQAGIGIVGAPVLVWACMHQFGGLGEAVSGWGGGLYHYFSQGVDGTAMTYMEITYPSMLTLGLNFSIFLVWGGQHYWMKAASCRTEDGARKAYIIGGVFLFFITMIIGMTGLYAGAFFPNEFTGNGGSVSPDSAYGFIIGKFSSGVGVFLMIFALAASLSTAAANLMASVSVVSKDIYQRFINQNADMKQMTQASRMITVIVTAISLALAFYPGGSTFLFAFATAWMAPAGILMAFGIYWRRITNTGALVGAACGAVFMTVWSAMNLLGIPFMGRPVGSWLHMSIIGIVTAIIPTVIVSLLTKPKYYGEASWKRCGESQAEIPLSKEDKQIIGYIDEGFTQMCELMDITTFAGEHLNQIIEKLDQNRYLCRDGLFAEKFWSFTLTEKGKKVVKSLQLPERKTDGIMGYDLEILKKLNVGVKTNPGVIISEMAKPDDPMKREYAAAVVKLIRGGYIAESGFLRREVSLTLKGQELVAHLDSK